MKWFKKQEENDDFASFKEVKENKTVVLEDVTSYSIQDEAINNIQDPRFFGKLQHLIDDIDITDINCNSHSIWVNHTSRGRFECDDINITSDELEKIAYKISNIENKQFNVVSPILEADFNDLRLQFTHASFSTSGTSMSIRKTPCIARMTELKMVKQEYCPDNVIEFFKNSIRSHLNFFIIGMTGDGKTELAKFLTSYIIDYERIITIEDTIELHLNQLYPMKDVVELKVSDRVSYDDAIKSCMRMLPKWILLSESRGYEVKELLKSVSTGAKIITTLHTDHVLNIPKRILNMLEGNELANDKIENIIYQSVDIGVRVKADVTNQSTYRYISQIAVFWLEIDNSKHHQIIYEVTKEYDKYFVNYYPLPSWIKQRFKEANCTINWEGDLNV